MRNKSSSQFGIANLCGVQSADGIISLDFLNPTTKLSHIKVIPSHHLSFFFSSFSYFSYCSPRNVFFLSHSILACWIKPSGYTLTNKRTSRVSGLLMKLFSNLNSEEPSNVAAHTHTHTYILWSRDPKSYKLFWR